MCVPIRDVHNYQKEELFVKGYLEIGTEMGGIRDEAINRYECQYAFLVGYDRSVPKLRQADHCIGCKQCNHHCPQRINIPKELHKIDAFIEKLKRDTL